MVDCNKIQYIDVQQYNNDGTVSVVRKYINIETSEEVPANMVKGCVNIAPLDTTCAIICNE